MTTISSRGGVAGSGSGTDHHCGWSYIAPSQIVVIAENKQSVVFGEFINDGEIQIEGTLVIEV